MLRFILARSGPLFCKKNIKMFKKSMNYYFLYFQGKKWQDRRKILTNAFHFNVLQKYFPIIEENDKLLLETLTSSNGEPVDVMPIISEYTLNTICGKFFYKWCMYCVS